MGNPIVLYDGVCGLCNRLVQFLLRHDKHDRLRFASLQSDLSSKILARHGADASDLDTVRLVVNYNEPDEKLLVRSNAILRAGVELGGLWSVMAIAAKIVPRALRDIVYRIVARNRYRVFGKYETCMLPDTNHRAKFLDV